MNSTLAAVCQLDPHFPALKVLYILLMASLLTLSLFGNLIVILAVIFSDRLRSRQTFPFAASLAGSDIVMALSQIPLRITVTVHDLHFCYSLPVCYVRQYTDYVGNVGSILNLFFVSFDRYMAIQLPFRYFQTLTTSRGKLIIAGVWIFSGTWGACGLFPWTHLQGITITSNGWCTTLNKYFIKISFWGIYFSTLIIVTVFYAQILRTAIKQIRKIENTTVVGGKSPKRLRKGSQFFKEIKATKTIAIVYVFFCLCWFPGLVVTIFQTVNLKGYLNLSMHTKVIIFYTLEICPAFSMTINPIIYSFSNSQFRKAVRSLVKRQWIRAAQSISYLNQASSVMNLDVTGRSPKTNKSKNTIETVFSDNYGRGGRGGEKRVSIAQLP